MFKGDVTSLFDSSFANELNAQLDRHQQKCKTPGFSVASLPDFTAGLSDNSHHCALARSARCALAINSLVSCPSACTKNPQNLQTWADGAHLRLVKENFYQYQEHLKFVCILFSSTLNNFRSQITGVSDQSASRLVLETQECYATL